MEKERRNAWPSDNLIKIWRFVRPLVVLALSLTITFFIFNKAFNYVLNRYIRPVDINDPTPIALVVEKSDSASRVAAKLYAACGENKPGLISNTAVFKVYVDFVGKANKLRAGTYILSKNMDIPQIVDIICAGNPARKTVKLTIQEGFTINGVLWALEQAGIQVDQTSFLRLSNDIEAYSKYSFLKDVQERDGRTRDYWLEGYLFPDTYEVYVDSTPDELINKMLIRFNDIFTDEYIARAKELNMSIDDIVTLASIVEREASVAEDFPRVSAVFHNRLKANQKLESCASLQYVLKVNKYVYTEQERATDSAYNTYLYPGLPAGPISNPGRLAIEAALYPDEEYLNADYRYFCNMELPENKSLIFARTYEDHLKNIEKYSKYW